MKYKSLSELYPKTELLENSEKLKIKIMTPDDLELVKAFFSEIPDEDKTFLRLNINNEIGIQKWIQRINEKTSFSLLAFLDGKLVAQASLHQDSMHSSRHVGHLRLRVAPEHRNKGIASILAGHIYQMAQRTKLEKLSVEIPEDHEIACRIFIDKLGFEKEAVLKDHVMDHNGIKHNLAILTKDTQLLLEELKRKLRFADVLYGGEY